MSFARPKTVIEENDTVIVYLSYTNMHAIDITPTMKNRKGENIENVFQTHYGSIRVKDLIGVKYGTKVSFHLDFFRDYFFLTILLVFCRFH